MKKIIAILLVLLIVFSFLGCQDEREPQIKEGEFPFVVEYEYQGKTYVIEDVVVCSYKGLIYDSGGPFGDRFFASYLKNDSNEMILQFEENTESFMVSGRINKRSCIKLDYGQGGYYMGDPNDVDRGPYIFYEECHQVYSSGGSRIEQTKLTNEQLEEIFGIKIIRFEFSSPIENTFE